MNEFLRKFDTIIFVAPWSIFRNFLGIFHFFEFKFKFWIWAGLIPDQTVTGPVPTGFVNPAYRIVDTEIATYGHRWWQASGQRRHKNNKCDGTWWLWTPSTCSLATGHPLANWRNCCSISKKWFYIFCCLDKGGKTSFFLSLHASTIHTATIYYWTG